MTMLRYILFLLLLSPFGVAGQMKVSLSFGYGTYAMKDLEKVQEEIKNSLPVEARNTSSFPGYYYYETGFHYTSHSRFHYGMQLVYGSTGARTAYRDYSGSIVNDFIVKYYSLQPSLGYNHAIDDNLNLIFDLRPGISLFGLDVNAKQTLGTESYSEKFTFNGFNAHIQPSLTLCRRIKRYGVKAFAGYQIDVFRSKLTLEDEPDAYLQKSNGQKAVADWSGMRVGLGIEYFFGK